MHVGIFQKYISTQTSKNYIASYIIYIYIYEIYEIAHTKIIFSRIQAPQVIQEFKTV